MTPAEEFRQLLQRPGPVLALAPMQDVTDLPFWTLMSRYGGADVYYTEYFRIHGTSHLSATILKSITANPTGRPVIAQMIGNDIPALVRAARELEQYPIAAVDLNLGCPAPIVYRKCAGGGLLREPQKVDAILGALRETLSIPFTVKTRLGFESPDGFEGLLQVFSRHALDLLTVHGRTVKEMYWSEVHYDLIARAVEQVPFPVLANGNIYSARNARDALARTKARGLMLGRGAIRNPWLFEQIRQMDNPMASPAPTGRDLLDYIRALYVMVQPPGAREVQQVQKMKKYMNFIGLGVDPDGQFLHQIRRVNTEQAFFEVCEAFLHHDHPVAAEPGSVEDSAPAGLCTSAHD